MAPIRTTGRKTRKATQPTSPTRSKISPKTSRRGNDNEPRAESPGAESTGAKSSGAKSPGAELPGAQSPGAQSPGVKSPTLTTREKGTISENKRRDNIKEEFCHLKAMIPSVKDVENIESSKGIMLEAINREVRKEINRRVMLQQRIAGIQQAINNAGNKGGKITPLPQGP